MILISSKKYLSTTFTSLSAAPSARGSIAVSSPATLNPDPYQYQYTPHHDRYVYVYPPSRSRSRIHIPGPRLNYHYNNTRSASSRIPGRLYNVTVDTFWRRRVSGCSVLLCIALFFSSNIHWQHRSALMIIPVLYLCLWKLCSLLFLYLHICNVLSTSTTHTCFVS